MPLPRWLARFNRRFINPGALKRESWPILTHVGRSSGKIRRTPLDAFPVDRGFVFIVNYGADRSDWVRNIMKASRATLRYEGEDIELTNPRIITKAEAVALGPDVVEPPPAWTRVDEFLWMEVA